MNDSQPPSSQPGSLASGAGPWGQRSAPLPELPPLPTAVSASAPGSATAGVEFTEQARDFLRLIVRGAWLQLLTFGFYRFWLNTDIRRHFWAHTLVDGEGAEYTGTARELLIGFLFALAVLVPIYLAYFLAGLAAEQIQAFASAPLGLFLVLFGQFVLYRARRYRLTRTVWRGVRFWMTGSGWSFAFRSFGWLILVVLTLGLLYPWRAAALERYKMRHTFYGNMQGSFDARGWDFFKRGVWLWLLALLPIVMFLSVIGSTVSGGKAAPAAVGQAVAVGSIGLLLLPVIWPFFQAIEWRWWASGVDLAGARLTSSIRGGRLFRLYAKFILLMFGVSIAAMAVLAISYAIAEALLIGVGGTSVRAVALKIMDISPYLGVAIMLLLYLIVGLAFGVVQRYVLQYQYWNLICDSLSVDNIKAVEGAEVRGELAGSLGEGLADGLDIGGF